MSHLNRNVSETASFSYSPSHSHIHRYKTQTLPRWYLRLCLMWCEVMLLGKDGKGGIGVLEGWEREKDSREIVSHSCVACICCVWCQKIKDLPLWVHHQTVSSPKLPVSTEHKSRTLIFSHPSDALIWHFHFLILILFHALKSAEAGKSHCRSRCSSL